MPLKSLLIKHHLQGSPLVVLLRLHYTHAEWIARQVRIQHGCEGMSGMGTVPVTDGFLGVDKESNTFTIDFRTSDKKNPYYSTVCLTLSLFNE